MKTYFLAWESDNKRGHALYDFPNDIKPRAALKEMLSGVMDEFDEVKIPLKGIISAKQFNRVD